MVFSRSFADFASPIAPAAMGFAKICETSSKISLDSEDNEPKTQVSFEIGSMISILFVCIANICRSPVLEATLRHFAIERSVADSIHVDSCAIGWSHLG